eukprot:428368-Karenia_brevis.AAC.1
MVSSVWVALSFCHKSSIAWFMRKRSGESPTSCSAIVCTRCPAGGGVIIANSSAPACSSAPATGFG